MTAGSLPFATADGDGVRLSVRVTTRARKAAFGGTVELPGGRHALAVRLAAPPVEGAANRALIAFLARRLGVPGSAVRLVAGEASRLKTVHVAGLDPAALRARLAREGGAGGAP